jgi:hypothetical protein
MSVEDLVERALADQAMEMSVVPDVEALVARGMQARRRRLAMLASIAATALIAAIVAGPMLWNRTGPAPVAGIPSPPATVEATATVGPGRGTGFFGGSLPEVPVTFTMPAGWEADGPFVNKSNADPVFGLVFLDIANIYSDGCRWKLVDPPPGPTVDDLVAAYDKIPGLQGAARDVTVNGFTGKQIEVKVPDYDEDECTNGQFAIVKTNDTSGAEPALWAQAPNQLNTLRILDVNGTRLVILTGDAGNVSAQDRSDVERILSSIQIG